MESSRGGTGAGTFLRDTVRAGVAATVGDGGALEEGTAVLPGATVLAAPTVEARLRMCRLELKDAIASFRR